jgi:copper homeostasis protein CutC
MLEVCVEDVGGLRAAVEGGANRIELCAALVVGGITPSAALIRAAAALSVPVHVLIRPRANDFVYDADETEVMVADIREALGAGLTGVVIGASRPDGTLDSSLLATLIAVAREAGDSRGRPVSLTLHRAFDLCPDQGAALEVAVSLGFDRVLTSGGAVSAADGRTVLADLVRRARGRIKILAGSGISPDNVGSILATGVEEIHASCQASRPGTNPKAIELGFDESQPKRTSAERVSALVSSIQQWSANHVNS